MIIPISFLTIALGVCLPLASSWRLTPLTIDQHPCKPEKLKNQARYICDSAGNIECLTGWKDKKYNKDKHFPCAEPICDPKCVNGECKLPNVCSCEIGWDGLDCGTCIDMPGCVNGGCTKFNDDTQKLEEEPLTCKCKDNWQGALCDIPKCPEDCNNNGICVDVAADEHVCKCNLGWGGAHCGECKWVMGCKTEHTIDVDGNGSGDGCKVNATVEVANSCQCTADWTGIFCEQPKCLEDGNEISCVNGQCIVGGKDKDGNVLAAFCKCSVGWAGTKCDKCVPHDECPNKDQQQSSDIAACINPNDCRCEGTAAADNSDANKKCFTWIATGTCGANQDCSGGQLCNNGNCE